MNRGRNRAWYTKNWHSDLVGISGVCFRDEKTFGIVFAIVRGFINKKKLEDKNED